ncbi:hypothetical protein [Legionella jordanis]|uniref:hypothetical protein n=1 Tax=Legionella jordanis TaxID=456 RepID=UPI0007D0809C|nr:hypothetical protein [Legionella jordanis]VEH11385.1 Uncharacterised protein [Legionella jordanis]
MENNQGKRSSDALENKPDLLNLANFPLLNEQAGLNTANSKSVLAEMLTIMVNDSLPNVN